MLLNLTASGELRFSLPKLYFGFETHFYDRTREIHKTRKLHTVVLEPDLARVSMVWHSPLPCPFKANKLRETIITLKTDVSTGQPAHEDIELELTG